MKIGLITAYYSEEFGGNEYYLAKELTKKGHEVFIYVSRFTPQRFGLKRTKKGSSLKNIHVIRLPSIGIKKWGLLFLWGLKKQIKNDNLDVVHVQEWFMPLIL
ncbi:MAG: glycosyltransferase family 4 protein, partial [Candidatus Woesearchaeota archaeon]